MGNIQKMNSRRIAVELFAHAILYIIGRGLLKSSRVSKTIIRFLVQEKLSF